MSSSPPCDYCPREEAGMSQTIKICCPDGQSVCLQCLHSVINASVQCTICERPLGKKIGSLKSEAKQRLTANQNQGQDYFNQTPKRNLNRTNSSGNIGQANSMKTIRNLNSNTSSSQNMGYYQQNGYSNVYPQQQQNFNPQWNCNQNYQYGQQSFDFFRNYCQPMNQNVQHPMNYQNSPNFMGPSQFCNPQQQPQYYNNIPQNMNMNSAWLMNQSHPSNHPQNSYQQQNSSQFKRQSMQRLMRSGSRSITQGQLLLEHDIDMQGDDLDGQQSSYNNCYSGTYSGSSRQPKTTDSISYESSQSLMARNNRSSSLNHTLRRK